MSEEKEPPTTNIRRFRRDSDRKYLYLVIFTLVVIGGTLIALIYGPKSLLTALPCLLGGAALILLPWGVLTIIQKWRDGLEQRARREAAAIEAEKRDDACRQT